jgi:hypothetical protein
MKLPFDRERMRERNLLDDIDEIEQAARLTPEERIRACLAMSAEARALALAFAGQDVMDEYDSVEEKAQLWVAPLRASVRR